jgi:GNAT superfamily N-acetyltransferase
MSVTHPSSCRIALLQKRWQGQEARLRAIASALLDGRDWTVHLAGLPMVDEVPPRPGEAYGRDLRGADLRRFLAPAPEIREAGEVDAALVSGISLEGLTHNTPLDGATPFPVVHESADEIARAMRRGDRFLVARAAGFAVGVVRWAQRSEFKERTADRPYVEISGLAVRPHARRQGVGLALLEAVQTQAAAEGFEHALLRTTLELGLVPWYERAGYATCLMRQLTCPDGPTILDVLMVRRLSVAAAAPVEPAPMAAAAPARARSNGHARSRVSVEPPVAPAAASSTRRYRA